MSITITLDDDEAIAIFEMLASKRIESQLPNLEPPERNALWALECCFEKVLVQPFTEDYAQILSEARKSLVERYGQ